MVSPSLRPALSAGPPETTALPVALDLVMVAPPRVTPVGFNRVGLDDHAEGNVLDLAVLDDFVGHTLDEVGRDGEADADGAGGVGGGGGGGDRGVDADHLAGRVEGRAAGVAGVDGRVDLDGVGDDLVVVVVGHGHRAVQAETIPVVAVSS